MPTNEGHGPGDGLLTSAEVADLLDVTHRTVTRRAKQGLIPFVKKAEGIRGDYLFHRADVERLAANEQADDLDGAA